MTKALIPLADGVEEMEAVILVDVLRRAKWNVTTAHVHAPGMPPSTIVTASRGVRLAPDTDWEKLDPDDFDALILPGGGGGTDRLMQFPLLLDAIRRFDQQKKMLGAVCAGPLVLQAAGILAGHTATCHPGVRQKLTAPTCSTQRVVISRHIVTSQGPGTMFEFALCLIKIRDGEPAADAVAQGMIL